MKFGPEDEGAASTLYDLGTCVRDAGRLQGADGIVETLFGSRGVNAGKG